MKVDWLSKRPAKNSVTFPEKPPTQSIESLEFKSKNRSVRERNSN
jgi:hypothetical protein